ncbi:hypothetical protein BH10PAT3_BH10PAT3_7430 [soil metagenome]
MASRRKYGVLLVLFMLIVIGGVVTFLVLKHRANSPQAKEARAYTILRIDMPVYATKRPDKYKLQRAYSEDSGSIVLSSYSSDKGVIGVTQQPKPAVDPFGSIKPVSTFVTESGDARLLPDNEGNPYIIINTPFTWVIVHTQSIKITSDDLKAFCLTLQKVSQE